MLCTRSSASVAALSSLLCVAMSFLTRACSSSTSTRSSFTVPSAATARFSLDSLHLCALSTLFFAPRARARARSRCPRIFLSSTALTWPAASFAFFFVAPSFSFFPFAPTFFPRFLAASNSFACLAVDVSILDFTRALVLRAHSCACSTRVSSVLHLSSARATAAACCSASSAAVGTRPPRAAPYARVYSASSCWRELRSSCATRTASAIRRGAPFTRLEPGREGP
eukprot:4266824-Pleurochrysis_carterae.AAC.2